MHCVVPALSVPSHCRAVRGMSVLRYGKTRASRNSPLPGLVETVNLALVNEREDSGSEIA